MKCIERVFHASIVGASDTVTIRNLGLPAGADRIDLAIWGSGWEMGGSNGSGFIAVEGESPPDQPTTTRPFSALVGCRNLSANSGIGGGGGGGLPVPVPPDFRGPVTVSSDIPFTLLMLRFRCYYD